MLIYKTYFNREGTKDIIIENNNIILLLQTLDTYMRGAIVKMNNVTYLTVVTLMTMCLCVQLTTGDTDADGAVMEDTRVKREALPANYSQIHTFVDKAQGLEESDLILLIDRSKAMTKREFYMKSRKLARTIINQYAAAHINYTRIAVLTFAVDVVVAFDFISRDENTTIEGTGTKREIFSGEDPLWERSVVYFDNETRSSGTDIKLGLEAARQIFASGRRARPGVRQTCVMMSDGNISNEEEDYAFSTVLHMDAEGIDIYTVAVGPWKIVGNVHIIATDPTFHNFFDRWVEMTENYPFAETADTPSHFVEVETTTCQENATDTPLANATCFNDIYTGYSKFLCNPGYFLNETTQSCSGCDYHSYKENYGNEQFDCRPCPSDYGTRETATTSVDQCICYNGTEPLDECPATSDACVSGNHTCSENQVCLSGNRDEEYQCACKLGFTGENCTTNIDDCENNNQCLNDGQCVDRLNDFFCSCKLGFLGQFCEIEEDNCIPDVCVNNSTCESQSRNRFTCHCQTYYNGIYCQDYKPPTTAAPVDNSTTADEGRNHQPVPTSPRPTSTPRDTNKPEEISDDGSGDSTMIIIIAAGAGGLLVLIIIISVVCIVVIQRRRRRERQADAKLPPPPELFEKPHYHKNKYGTKSGLRKTISKHFSGFWKPKTVRGGFDAEKSEGTPSAPTKQRPDLLALSNVNLVDEVQLENQQIEDDTSMNGWKSYLKDLETSGVIRSACIAKFESSKHADSSTYAFNQRELDTLIELVKSGDTSVPTHIQGGEYRIVENDGSIAVGLSMGSCNDMVFIGKTLKFLIVAIADQIDDNSNPECRKEVQWIVDHISGEGY